VTQIGGNLRFSGQLTLVNVNEMIAKVRLHRSNRRANGGGRIKTHLVKGWHHAALRKFTQQSTLGLARTRAMLRSVGGKLGAIGANLFFGGGEFLLCRLVTRREENMRGRARSLCLGQAKDGRENVEGHHTNHEGHRVYGKFHRTDFNILEIPGALAPCGSLDKSTLQAAP
jgi:hypothetical protein